MKAPFLVLVSFLLALLPPASHAQGLPGSGLGSLYDTIRETAESVASGLSFGPPAWYLDLDEEDLAAVEIDHVVYAYEALVQSDRVLLFRTGEGVLGKARLHLYRLPLDENGKPVELDEDCRTLECQLAQSELIRDSQCDGMPLSAPCTHLSFHDIVVFGPGGPRAIDSFSVRPGERVDLDAGVTFPSSHPEADFVVGTDRYPDEQMIRARNGASFLLLDRLAAYEAVDFEEIREAVDTLSMADDVRPREDWLISTANVIYYQTSEGRFGKLRVETHPRIAGFALWWTTYDREGREVSSGHLPGDFPQVSIDLDYGVERTIGQDLILEIGAWTTSARLYPRQGARFRIRDEPPTYESLEALDLPLRRLHGQPLEEAELDPAGENVVVFRTGNGNHGKLEVYPLSCREPFSSSSWTGHGARWQVFDAGGSLIWGDFVHLSSIHCGFSPRVHHAFQDLESSSSTHHEEASTDFEILRGPSGWSLVPRNGLRWQLLSRDAPHLTYESVDAAFLSSLTLGRADIEISGLGPGAILGYWTGDGRLGKIEIQETGNPLAVSWRTFSYGTPEWSAGGDLVLDGSPGARRLVDLDTGETLTDAGWSSDVDLRLRVTAGEHWIEPLNGTRISVLSRGEQDSLIEELGEESGSGKPIGVPAVYQERFVRGDVDGNGRVDIADTVDLTRILFVDETWANCLDAADVNDSGHLSLSDYTHLYLYLFEKGAPPPAPFASCGVDPTPDSLDCGREPCEVEG